MTPNVRFTDFIKDITPSTTTNTRSATAHHAVREALTSDDEYRDEVLRTFLGGSYKRKTAIRPVTKGSDTERPDVDIYVVVTGSYWTRTPHDLIEGLYAALHRNRTSLGIAKISRNRCSISVSTGKADMDVSPILDRNTNGYYGIGNRHTNEWYETEPETHTTWSAKINVDTSGRFNPMVKMVKWTRREFPTKSKHPKSIALEGLIEKYMSRSETHYGKLVHDTFNRIIDAYAIDRLLGTCPIVDDPAILGGNLLDGVSGDVFSAFYDKTKYFRDEAAKALATDDQEEATVHWRCIFGSRFPPPKLNSPSRPSTLKAAIPMSPLAFPDKPSAPPNKPADFA